MIDQGAVRSVLRAFTDLELVAEDEGRAVLSLFDDVFPFGDALRLAETLHVHGRVDDVSSLPDERIKAAGGAVENRRDGYVKYAFAGGVNLIWSSIPVAQDDLLDDAAKRPRPFLDHVGIDLRRELPEVRAVFESVPTRAAELGWRHVPQGGDDKPVFCCHTSVARKHWVYPTADASFRAPIEVAFGPLVIHAGKMGCDLRPIDPAHPRAAEAVCGGHAPAEAGSAASGAGYYDPLDLGRFGNVGKHATDTWSKFLAYYTAATATDTALTKREKALIGLAVAHSKQCPYCIDAYTGSCLDSGATPEQMHDAVHVAAALAAGIDLVHATQMHNALRRRGAIE